MAIGTRFTAMPPLLRGTVGVLSLLAYVLGTAIFTITVHGISTSDEGESVPKVVHPQR